MGGPCSSIGGQVRAADGPLYDDYLIVHTLSLNLVDVFTPFC